uniref:DNA 3'-5' helicase n=1 Tax=Legionella pneumophila TaxID=446 RepID=Q9S3U7_LEGPN|nr:rep helicase [Legionella pneumophila]
MCMEYWQNKIRHLLVDEYQDSNSSQYLLVKKLAGVRAHFTVVGDDDQSIYAWRGAKPENLAQLQKDFPRLKIIKLEQNYRSTSRILHAANHLIAHNQHLFEKKLWSDLGHGELLRVVSCKDEQDEAEHVIAGFGRAINYVIGQKYSDYTILYRGNHQARIFEKVLRHHGIPYHISGGQSWFAKLEVRDIFAYLKLLCNEADDAAFLRAITTPKRGIGESSLEALGRYAQSRGISLYHGSDHLALSEFVADKQRMIFHDFKLWMEDIKKRISSDSVLEHLRHDVDGIDKLIFMNNVILPPRHKKKWIMYGSFWNGLIVCWIRNLNNRSWMLWIDWYWSIYWNNPMNLQVMWSQLMTLHASKGLEFPFIYLVGMEEELLPHRVSIDDDQIEEERRLAYVGITRAQKGLCFTLAKQRRRAGELQDCVPSRFLDELPQESLEWFGKGGERCEEQSKKLAKSHLEGLKNMLS